MKPGRLRRLRRCRNWSQRELAGEAGVSQPTISAIETGDRGLTGAAGERIAAAFGLTRDELRAGACAHCDDSPEAVFACLAWARRTAP
jgi:transcriptional regulator with XRE-family HTH domain